MLKARDVGRALTRKGFADDGERDHHYYFFYHNGKKSNIYTKISHGEIDLGKPLCSAMARQMKLTGQQFQEFVSCQLDAQKYAEILTGGGYLG
jgi:hypothetical protein